MIMNAFLQNQIAMALILFAILGIGSMWTLDPPSVKEIVVQIITATGALVTGVAVGRRSSDTSDNSKKIV
jgi:prepilin signal peptidase PulO-like enzyme (type II secretory pathway)